MVGEMRILKLFGQACSFLCFNIFCVVIGVCFGVLMKKTLSRKFL